MVGFEIIGLPHLSLTASARAGLPQRSGDALHTKALQLQEKLESLE